MMGKCKIACCVLLEFTNRLLSLLHFELKRKIKKPKALVNHSYNRVNYITYITVIQLPIITEQGNKVFTAVP